MKRKVNSHAVVLDDVTEKMDKADRPVQVSKPSEAVSINEAMDIIQKQSSFVPVDVPLSPLDALLLGRKLTVLSPKKDGSVITYNPNGKPPVRLKPNDTVAAMPMGADRKEFELRSIFAAMIQNSMSYSVEVLWTFAKLANPLLTFSEVKEYGTRELEKRCNDKEIELMNPFDKTYCPIGANKPYDNGTQ